MILESDHGSAERIREQLKAERVLAQMDVAEDVAELWETEGVPIVRERFAAQYLRIVGVDPGRRAELRTALEVIRDGGGMPVDDAIESLRQSNRVAFGGSVAGRG